MSENEKTEKLEYQTEEEKKLKGLLMSLMLFSFL